MQKKTFTAMTAVGLAAAIAIPTMAFGNARRNVGNLAGLRAAETPLVARLLGANEVPVAPATTAGDPDGVGAAAVTFDVVSVPPQVCWDLSYSGIAAPDAAHIHRGVTGVNGPVVVPLFPTLGATSGTGCATVDAVLGAEIVATPANFYVNVHNPLPDFPGGALRGQLAAGSPPAGEAHFLAVPLRAYDSRLNAGAKILPGETRTISLATGFTLAVPPVNSVAVPPGATAAIITLTVAETVGGGFLTIYSAAVSQPATSNINWKAPDQDIAAGTQVAVDAAGSVKVTDGIGGGATHFLIDVVGYLY
jgi:CHRD domain-containing protein